MIPVVILAGGLATRLYPKTHTIPKSLIQINGRPFIEHQLKLLKEKGVSQVVICIGHLGDQIKQFVKDGSQYELNVQYSYDGDLLLGTGGAIKKAMDILPDVFMILYGDSYLDINYKSVVDKFEFDKLPVMMTVYRNYNVLDVSNILMKEGKIVRYNKDNINSEMEYIDFGLIVVNKYIFDLYPSNEPFELSLVLSRAVDEGKVSAYEVKQRFFEIGSSQGIKETEEYIRNRIVSYNSELNEH